MSIRFLANLVEDSHTGECSHDPNCAYQQLNLDILNLIRAAKDWDWILVIQILHTRQKLVCPCLRRQVLSRDCLSVGFKYFKESHSECRLKRGMCLGLFET